MTALHVANAEMDPDDSGISLHIEAHQPVDVQISDMLKINCLHVLHYFGELCICQLLCCGARCKIQPSTHDAT